MKTTTHLGAIQLFRKMTIGSSVGLLILFFFLLNFTSTFGQTIMFDDFTYSGNTDPQFSVFNKWNIVDGVSGPPEGGVYSRNNVGFVADPSNPANKLLTMSTTVTTNPNGTKATTHSRIETGGYEYFEGTYSSRVYLSDVPYTYKDANIQTFYTIVSSSLSGDGSKYSELDVVEYMAADKWGTSTDNPVLYVTSWNRYIAEPWQAWKRYFAYPKSYAGWHTFTASCTDGVNVKYWIDDTYLGTQSTTDNDGSSVYPRSNMHVAFANWIWNNVVGSSSANRTTTMQVDWTLHYKDQELTPQQVASQVATFRSQGIQRRNLAGQTYVSNPCPVPAQPGTISGNTSVTSGSNQTYSVAAVANATSYTWTLPSGWSGTSTSTTITTTAGSAGGTISVRANNACGTSASRTLAVTVTCNAPAQPGGISGNTTVATGSSQTYSIATVNGAASYTWTLPSGWSGNSTSTSITTTAGSAGGTISVRANNSCGTSAARTLGVTVSCVVPAQPGVISGNTSVASGTSQTYSITAVANATSYIWTLPSGWSGASTSTSITAIAGSSGTISVVANSACGSSAARTLAVTVTVSSNLALNKPVTVSSVEPGSSFAGSGAVDGNFSTRWSSDYVDPSWMYVDLGASYDVNRVKITWEAAYSTSYLVQISTDAVSWQTMRAVTGNASLVNDWTGLTGTGRYVRIYGTVRSTQWGHSIFEFEVYGTSGCTAPAQPGVITGNTSVPSGSSQTYSVAAVSGATSYTWTLPSGWSGTSNSASVSTTAGATGGTISVRANNACGTSAVRMLTVAVTPSEQSPYGGTASAIPGTIEAENYDLGGQNIAFNEVTAANEGAAYRTDAVDIEATNGGGFNVGWIAANEWLEYTVNVTTAGNYKIDVRVAAITSGKTFRIEMDGASIGTFTVPNTTGWQLWQTVSLNNIALTTGQKVMRVFAIGAEFNLDKMIFTSQTVNMAPSVNITSPANNASFTAPANISITANASDSDGSVSLVEFFRGSDKIGEDATSPYSIIWTGATAGTYSLTAKAIDDKGAITTSAAVSITVINSGTVQSPFGGSVRAIPGTIQAEDYDLGGQGIAFNESTAANEGAAYRTDAVDVEPNTDNGGGYNVGYVLAGEWLEYTVNVTTNGSYQLDLRVAAITAGKSFHVEMDGINISGPIAVPNTFGWDSWQTVTVNTIQLTAGQKIMRVVFDAPDMNLNYVTFSATPSMPMSSQQEAPESMLTISSNPFVSTATVGVVVTEQGEVSVRVYDLSGFLVKIISEGNLNIGAYKFELDATGLKNDLYIIKCITPDGESSLRVMKVE